MITVHRGLYRSPFDEWCQEARDASTVWNFGLNQQRKCLLLRRNGLSPTYRMPRPRWVAELAHLGRVQRSFEHRVDHSFDRHQARFRQQRGQRHSGRRHTADASGRRRNVPIAEAAHGFDRLEAVRYLAELPPEVRDVQLPGPARHLPRGPTHARRAGRRRARCRHARSTRRGGGTRAG